MRRTPKDGQISVQSFGNFGRYPSKPEDFVWNLVDFARCSIVVRSAKDLLEVKQLIEKNFKVVCVKNGYNSKVKVKGSGYRDLKMILQVDFEGLQLCNIPKAKSKTSLLCEVQILCNTWLHNKKTTSLSYKILRANTLNYLFKDASKYFEVDSKDDTTINPVDVLQHGWINLAKGADFSGINVNDLLQEAVKKNWDSLGVQIMVEELGAELMPTNRSLLPPIVFAAANGSEDCLKTLIALKSDLTAMCNYDRTPLHWAAVNGNENCVRILIAAGSNVNAKDWQGATPLTYANEKLDGNNKETYRRIAEMLKGKTVRPIRGSGKQKDETDFDRASRAMIKGELAKFFDSDDLELSKAGELLATPGAVSTLENTMQLLWFGSNVRYVSNNGWSALLWAAKYGTCDTIRALLKAKADINFREEVNHWNVLHLAVARDRDIMKIFIEAGADLEARDGRGYTPLLISTRRQLFGSVRALVDAGANKNAKTINGDGISQLAKGQRMRQLLKLV